jgi:hypothetical protein
VASPDELADEARRARKVRQVVDIATNLIAQSHMSRADAERLVSIVRERVLTLFPGGEETFEVVYARRFKRLIDEFTEPRGGRCGVLLSFRQPNR